MKKILSINGTSFYSTGTIIKNIENGLSDIYDFYRATADEKGSKQYEITGKYIVRQFGKIPSQLFGQDGFMFRHETKKMVKWIDSIKPDLIHIHNVHGYFMNVEILLKYAFENKIPIIYTMHDCWTFTGRCAYFDGTQCFKWKDGCGKCPHKMSYPKSRLFDLSKKQWEKKRELFCGKNIHFVSPSNWLKNYTVDSFLKHEDIRVINNGIQTDVFSGNSESFDLPASFDFSKKTILSVAYPFTVQKGLKDINKLQTIIDKEKYQIVVVGVTEDEKTEDGIIRIQPTKNKAFLAYLYQIAYVFVSFTYQDNYPTVLLESLSSGTPVVTYNVGGCPEIVEDGTTGFCVSVGDVAEAYHCINKINTISRECCREFGQKHSIRNFVEEYHKIYKEILGD